MSRRQLLSFLSVVILAFFALIPDANALGGSQPPLNQPAPDFSPILMRNFVTRRG